MNLYVDSSVLLRVLFREPDQLRAWGQEERRVSSELIRVEMLRVFDRSRIRAKLSDEVYAEGRSGILRRLESFELVDLGSVVLERAASPFPSVLGTLDALHLASALVARERYPDLVVATHDAQLGRAARTMGLEVLGVGASR